MQTLAVASQKGGVGKTTISVNLAGALAAKKKRVLVIDMDSQANASAWLGAPDGGTGLVEAFTENKPLADLAQESVAEGIDVIASSLHLVKVERALAGEPGAEMIFRNALRRLPKKWDYIILDTPPTLGFLCVSALAASNFVIIPTETSYMALGGLQELIKTAEVVRDRMNSKLNIMGIVASRFDSRTKHAAGMVAFLREEYGDLMFNAVIRQTVRVQEAATFMLPINVHDPRGRVTQDYADLADEVLSRSERHG